MYRTTNLDKIQRSFHRSTFSHFERIRSITESLEQKQTNSLEKNQQQAIHLSEKHPQEQALHLLMELLHRQMVVHRHRRRQRQERYKRKYTLAVLNQVAFRLSELAEIVQKKKPCRGGFRSKYQHQDSIGNGRGSISNVLYEEHDYLGDASTVSSYKMNSQVQSSSSSQGLIPPPIQCVS